MHILIQGAGTMFCRRNQWAGAKFPRPLFHDSTSKRGSVLMHSKASVWIPAFPKIYDTFLDDSCHVS